MIISVSTSSREAAIDDDEEFGNSFISIDQLQNDFREWLALQVERGLIIVLFKC